MEAAPDAAPELEDVPDEEILEDDEEDGFQGDHESEDSNENEPTEFSEFPFKNVESAISKFPLTLTYVFIAISIAIT